MSKKNLDIAIIGVSSLFPSASTNIEYWENLKNGTVNIKEIPEGRWQHNKYWAGKKNEKYKIYCPNMGTVEDSKRFDNEYFNITDEEARVLDPQQRVSLELSKKLFDDAGYSKDEYCGRNVSLFIGASQSSTTEMLNFYCKAMQLDGELKKEVFDKFGEFPWHTNLTPNAATNLIAGRVSHEMNLKGPSMVIDTACSSSLVALHYACLSLLAGEAEMAISGGIYLLNNPVAVMTFSAAGALSEKGMLSAFDESADGFVPSEGAGFVLLKKLSDAQRDRDHIYAVIKGSTINNDGHTLGVMSPNPTEQRKVIQDFYENSEIKPNMLQYVEAHGTGTKIGDLSEFNSLSRAFNNWDIPKNSIFLGSGKSNIGHTIAASGAASLVRVIGMMKDNCVYQQANFNLANKKLNFNKSPFKIPTETIYFEQPGYLEYASINSFGFGGTNAHLILENGEKYNQRLEPAQLTEYFVTIGAHTKQVLKQRIKNIIKSLEDKAFNLHDFILWNNRINHEYQWNLSGVVSDHSSFIQLLETGDIVSREQKCSMLLFTGQGSQYLHMGENLYLQIPEFKKNLDLCASLFEKESSIKILDLIYGSKDKSVLVPTQVTQAVVFAVDYSLGKLLLDAELKPNYMIGHSIGEWVAAVLANVVTLEDGVKIICKRSSLMSKMDGKGKMVAVFTKPDKLTDYMKKFRVYFSSKNISHVVIGGESGEIDKFIKVLQENNISFSLLNVASAFHTPLFSEVKEEFEKFLDSFTFMEPEISIIGNVNGQKIKEYTSSYWAEHLTSPVLFDECMDFAYQNGVRGVVECGSKNILLNMVHSVEEYRSTMKLVHLLSSKDSSLREFSQGILSISQICPEFTVSQIYKGIDYGKPEYPEYPFLGKRDSIFVDFEEGFTHKWVWEKVEARELKMLANPISINMGMTEHFNTVNQPLEDFLHDLKREINSRIKDQTNIDIVYQLPEMKSIRIHNYEKVRDLLFQYSQNIMKVLKEYEEVIFNLVIIADRCSEGYNYAFHNSLCNFLSSLSMQMKWVQTSVVFHKGPDSMDIKYFLPGNWVKIEEKTYFIRKLEKYEIKNKINWNEYDNKNIMVVGGYGSIGEQISRCLLRETNSKLIIIGRNKNIDQVIHKIEKWDNSSARVYYYSCDIADYSEFSETITRIEAEIGQINMLFHLAGRINKNTFCSLNSPFSDISEVLEPKILGTMVINEVFKDRNLEKLILLSSISATDSRWAAGLADYSAANAFLNGFADISDIPVIALNYTLIDSDTGIDRSFDAISKNRMLNESGITTINMKQAMNAMFAVLGNEHEGGTVHVYKEFEAKAMEEAAVTEIKIENTGKEVSKIRVNIQDLEASLFTIISGFTKEKITAQNRECNFMELGIDSMKAISLIESLKDELNVALYPTIIFEYQTPYELYRYIADNYKEEEVTHTVQTEDNVAGTGRPPEEGVAIVGIDLITASAETRQKFWDILKSGTNCIEGIPDEHFISKDENKELTGGFIQNVYEFDPMFFGISPVEAKYMDPQQRKFLESCYESLQSAGCLGEFVSKNIGVYVGVEQNNYYEQFSNSRITDRLEDIIENKEKIAELKEILGASKLSADSIPGNSLNEIAGRVSYTFGLTGPSLVLNTACSSSLVALSVANSDLLAGNIDAAVVGGVNMNLSDMSFVGLSKLNALSKTNSSKPFDQGADGMVLGEAVISVVLKTVERARLDGNYIYGMVESIATNNNGFAQGITVPTVSGQKNVIVKATEKNEQIYKKLKYIEAHGTATPLGDPIEVSSIVNALDSKLSDRCYIGSNKGNFGHTLAASGLLSVAKVLGIFEHNIIPPIANFKTINSKIAPLENTNFALAAQAVNINEEDYYAGINAFGFGGTNAHVVLKKNRNERNEEMRYPQIVTLSHYSMEMLQKKAEKLNTSITEDNVGVILKKLNCHSKIFPYKLAFAAKNFTDLKEKIGRIQKGDFGRDIFKERVNSKLTQANIYLSEKNQLSQSALLEFTQLLTGERIMDTNHDKTVSDKAEFLKLCELMSKKSKCKFDLLENITENQNKTEDFLDMSEFKLSSAEELFEMLAKLYCSGVVFDFRNLYRGMCLKDDYRITAYNRRSYRAKEAKKISFQQDSDSLFTEITYKNSLA